MFELEATADMLLPTPQAKASTDTPETRIEIVLVKAVLDGDRDSFGRLYELYAPMVHGILLARVPHNDVDDLVQDVFLRALPKLRDLRDAAKFGPWLAAITRNCANDFHRQTRTIAAATDSLSEDEAELPASKPAPVAEAAMILSFVRSLPNAYRETLILRLVEGMTGPEIAARTGLTPGSVRVNLHRGMQQLREKLSQAAPDTSIQPQARLGRNSRLQEKNGLRGRNEP